jgi:hypothetical protein
MENAAQTAYVPTGSQLVPIEVTQIRQGSDISSSNPSLSAIFSAEQRVDVRIISRQATQGELADKKNEVLRAFASQDIKDEGELLLENVPVHKVQSRGSAGQPDSLQNLLSLVLDKNDAAKLTAAARKGHIRLLVHQEQTQPEAKQPEPVYAENVVPEAAAKIADSFNEAPVSPQLELQPLPVSVPYEPMPMEVPTIADRREPLEPASAIALQTISSEPVRKTAPAPATPDIFDPVLPPAPVPAASVHEYALPKTPAETVPLPPYSLVIKERMSIRNDAPLLSFGTPVLRVIPEQQAKLEHVLAKPASESEPGHEALVRPTPKSEPEQVRISPSLRFQSPGTATKADIEPAQSGTAESESPLLSSASAIATMPEKMQGYSPFERRNYAAPSNGNLGKKSDEDPPAPPRLLKNSRTGE